MVALIPGHSLDAKTVRFKPSEISLPASHSYMSSIFLKWLKEESQAFVLWLYKLLNVFPVLDNVLLLLETLGTDYKQISH